MFCQIYKYGFCIVTLAVGAVLCSGCSKIPLPGKGESAKDVPAPELPDASPTTVKVDGTALALNRPEQNEQERKAFLKRFEDLLSQDRTAAAQLWVERHPDFALSTLLDHQSEELKPHVLLQLASMHDTHCALSQAGSWHALLLARQHKTIDDEAYLKDRATLMRLLRSGLFDQTAQIDLVASAKKSGNMLLLIDAYQQQGVMYFVLQKPEQAAQSFEQARALAENTVPLQSAHAGLMLSESLRRAGNIPAANAAWASSVNLAAQLLSRPRPVADPSYWERAQYLHPVNIPWPPAVAHNMHLLATSGFGPARTLELQRLAFSLQHPQPQLTVVYLRTALGGWYLQRYQPQQALIEFKQAETVASADTAMWLRLAEARSLALLGQRGAAHGILMHLASQETVTPIKLAAMADLGSLRVQDGAVQQGLGLLKRSIEDNAAALWPGRSGAQADLALTYLMLDDENAALPHLEQAQAAFEAEGDQELLAKSLWNEARYWEHKKQKKQLAKVETRLEEMRF